MSNNLFCGLTAWTTLPLNGNVKVIHCCNITSCAQRFVINYYWLYCPHKYIRKKLFWVFLSVCTISVVQSIDTAISSPYLRIKSSSVTAFSMSIFCKWCGTFSSIVVLLSTSFSTSSPFVGFHFYILTCHLLLFLYRAGPTFFPWYIFGNLHLHILFVCGISDFTSHTAVIGCLMICWWHHFLIIRRFGFNAF